MREGGRVLERIWEALFAKPGETLRSTVQFAFIIGLVGCVIGSVMLGVIVGDETESVLLAILAIPFAFLLLATADYLLILPMLCFAELVINSGRDKVGTPAPATAPAVQQPVQAAQPAKPVQQPVPERKPAVKKQIPVVPTAPAPKAPVTMKDILEYSLRFESVRGMVDYLRVKGAGVTPEEKQRLDEVLNAADPRAAALAWMKKLNEQDAAD